MILPTWAHLRSFQRRWTDPKWARGMDYVQTTLVEALGS
jgi:hypothetical protein